MKMPVYQSGETRIYLDPVENTVPFPSTIIVDNNIYNFDIHYLCSTNKQIKKLKEHFHKLNIEYCSYTLK